MAYSESQIENDVERLLRNLVRDCESKAECDRCGDDDVSISGGDSLAREYARKIASQITTRLRAR